MSMKKTPVSQVLAGTRPFPNKVYQSARVPVLGKKDVFVRGPKNYYQGMYREASGDTYMDTYVAASTARKIKALHRIVNALAFPQTSGAVLSNPSKAAQLEKTLKELEQLSIDVAVDLKTVQDILKTNINRLKKE